MFIMKIFKSLHTEMIDKKVWVITQERRLNKYGKVIPCQKKMAVYPGTITELIIGTNNYYNRECYPSTEVEVLLECPITVNGEEEIHYINSGRVLLNVSCFDSEAEAKEELERMSSRTVSEQKLFSAKQMDVSE